MKSYKILFIILMISLFMISVSQIEAKTAKKIELKFGHVLQTDHPYHKMALKFKEELGKRNDHIVVQVHLRK